MLYSMTGYGRKELQIGNDTILIEVKTLNGKQLDLNTKTSTSLRPHELGFRNLLKDNLHRGSVDCSVFYNQNGTAKAMSLNKELAKSYYASLLELADELNLEVKDVLMSILALPEVIAPEQSEIDENLVNTIFNQLQIVLDEVVAFREKEGVVLYDDLKSKIENIQQLLSQVELPEKERIDRIKERIQKSLNDIANDNLDENRLEQEMIYFIEKIDISEEKTRLGQHCKLFLEMIENDNAKGIGKKLNFVLQEIGREINTLGSKANDATIQSIVVNMKDELEKAKEQSLNVL